MGPGDRRIIRRISLFHIWSSRETLSQTRTDKWGCLLQSHVHCGWWACALTHEDEHMRAHTHVHMCTHTVQCTNCLIFMHLCCLSCYTLSVHSKAVHRDVSKYLMFYNCSDLLHVLGHNHTEEDSMNSWENVHSAVRILLSVYYPTICLSCFSLSPSPSWFIAFFLFEEGIMIPWDHI